MSYGVDGCSLVRRRFDFSTKPEWWLGLGIVASHGDPALGQLRNGTAVRPDEKVKVRLRKFEEEPVRVFVSEVGRRALPGEAVNSAPRSASLLALKSLGHEHLLVKLFLSPQNFQFHPSQTISDTAASPIDPFPTLHPMATALRLTSFALRTSAATPWRRAVFNACRAYSTGKNQVGSLRFVTYLYYEADFACSR
jgi:hypothetical protein